MHLYTFAQPIVILWLVYWRKRRAFASLDLVIKMFAVGFWLTTTVAGIIEVIMQALLVIIFAAFAGVSLAGTDDATTGPSSSFLSETAAITGDRADLQAAARKMFPLVVLELFIMAFVIAGGGHLCKQCVALHLSPRVQV
jgi:hypothetical protein